MVINQINPFNIGKNRLKTYTKMLKVAKKR